MDEPSGAVVSVDDATLVSVTFTVTGLDWPILVDRHVNGAFGALQIHCSPGSSIRWPRSSSTIRRSGAA